MGWREDEAARYRQQIERMQHCLEMIDGGVLVTGEGLAAGSLEHGDDKLVAHYRDTIEALATALARLEGHQ